jgi:hypothetical protein
MSLNLNHLEMQRQLLYSRKNSRILTFQASLNLIALGSKPQKWTVFVLAEILRVRPDD